MTSPLRVGGAWGNLANERLGIMELAISNLCLMKECSENSLYSHVF